MEELQTLLEGLVVGLRGQRRKALDGVVASLRSNLKEMRREADSLHRRAYDNHYSVDSLERERRGLQKRIATLEAEHRATVAKYKAALADVAKDLINAPEGDAE
jgi:uncharacterized coiled-coil DUF342 family protein